jgi:hypothetical protein
MKLIPTQNLKYALKWKCHLCASWVDADLEICQECHTPRPLEPRRAAGRKHLLGMLDTVVAYSDDHGMPMTSGILRALIIALETETEGYLYPLSRSFAMLHKHYRQDGKKFLSSKGVWKEIG